MSPQRAVHIITEVAKAVDFAHAHHVVHRDITCTGTILSKSVVSSTFSGAAMRGPMPNRARGDTSRASPIRR
jgi:serine/threonine protein kinase